MGAAGADQTRGLADASTTQRQCVLQHSTVRLAVAVRDEPHWLAQLGRQMPDLDPLPSLRSSLDIRQLHERGQVSQIPAIIAQAEDGERVGRYLTGTIQSRPVATRGEEVLHVNRDLRSPLVQGRQADLQATEAIADVRCEHAPLQQHIGGGGPWRK